MAAPVNPILGRQAGLAPWLRQATAAAPSPMPAPGAVPSAQSAPWYAPALAASKAKAIPPEMLQQMLMAEQLRQSQEAVARAEAAQPEGSESWIGKYGVDPVSRRLGIEPPGVGPRVGRLFGFSR